MVKRVRDWLNHFYAWLREHWYVSALFYIVSSAVIVVVEFFGKDIGLVNQSGDLTSWGKGILIAAITIISLFGLIKEYADFTFIRGSKEGQEVLKRVLQGVTEAKTKKRDRFIKYIHQYQSHPPENPFPHITQPEKQLEEILGELQKTFADIFAISEDQIGLSVVCKLPDEEEWRVPGRSNVGTDAHIREFIHKPNSAFRPIVNGQREIVFIPDKAKASLEGRYASGEKDFGTNHVGSIICIAADVSEGRHFVQGILAISTYGNTLYEEGDHLTELKIREQILPAFLRRIQLELALLYIKSKMYQPTP